MSHKMLAHIILIIGVIELLLIFLIFVPAGYFEFLTIIGVWFVLCLPVFAMSLMWRYLPETSHVKKSLYSWAMMVIFMLMIASLSFGWDHLREGFVSIFGLSFLYGTVWTIAILAPAALIYRLKGNKFKDSAKVENVDPEPSDPTVNV